MADIRSMQASLSDNVTMHAADGSLPTCQRHELLYSWFSRGSPLSAPPRDRQCFTFRAARATSINLISLDDPPAHTRATASIAILSRGLTARWSKPCCARNPHKELEGRG
jgi:hypothetical protein